MEARTVSGTHLRLQDTQGTRRIKENGAVRWLYGTCTATHGLRGLFFREVGLECITSWLDIGPLCAARELEGVPSRLPAGSNPKLLVYAVDEADWERDAALGSGVPTASDRFNDCTLSEWTAAARRVASKGLFTLLSCSIES